jgi:hypothetical protein
VGYLIFIGCKLSTLVAEIGVNPISKKNEVLRMRCDHTIITGHGSESDQISQDSTCAEGNRVDFARPGGTVVEDCTIISNLTTVENEHRATDHDDDWFRTG